MATLPQLIEDDIQRLDQALGEFITAADATARKSYAQAVNFSAQIAHDPTATAADKIEYLQLLHLANDAARLTLDEVAEWSAIYGKEFVEM